MYFEQADGSSESVDAFVFISQFSGKAMCLQWNSDKAQEINVGQCAVDSALMQQPLSDQSDDVVPPLPSLSIASSEFSFKLDVVVYEAAAPEITKTEVKQYSALEVKQQDASVKEEIRRLAEEAEKVRVEKQRLEEQKLAIERERSALEQEKLAFQERTLNRRDAIQVVVERIEPKSVANYEQHASSRMQPMSIASVGSPKRPAKPAERGWWCALL